MIIMIIIKHHSEFCNESFDFFRVIEHNVFLSDKALHLFLQSNLNVKQIESYLIGEPLEMDVEYQRTERSSSDERNSQDAKRSNQTEPSNSGGAHQSTKTRTAADNNSTLKKINEDDLGNAKSERLSGLDEDVENTDKGKGFVYESFNQIESENCSGSSAGSSSFVICPDEVITGGSTDGSQHVSSLESSLGSIVCKSSACDQSRGSTPDVAVENELTCDQSPEITDDISNADVLIPGASHNDSNHEVSSSRHQAESGAENCIKLSCDQSSEVDLKVTADVAHHVSQSEVINQDTRCENSIEIDEQMSNDHSPESFDKSSPHHELSDVTTQADANLQDSGFVGQSPISSTFYEPTDLNTLVKDVTIADNINSNVTQNASNISSGMQFDVLPGEENSKISMIAAEDSQLEERDKTAYTNSESSSIQK